MTGQVGAAVRRRRTVIAVSAVAAVAGAAILVALVYPWARWREDFFPGRPPTMTLKPNAWTEDADFVRFAVLGDSGSGGRNAMAIASRMAEAYQATPYGMVLHVGDVSYYGSIADRWADVFVRPYRPLLDAGVRFEIAVGNHEYEETPSATANAEIAELLRLAGEQGRYFRVRRGPVDFFVLDSSTPLITGNAAAEQLAWLEAELAASDAPWKVVALHHPPYSSGKRGSWLQVRDAVEPLFVRYGVDLVFAGHDHFYERTTPQQGVVYVISGGGCKRSPVGRSDFTAVSRDTLQFMVVDVDGDELRARAIDDRGSVFDQFTLRKGQTEVAP
jgi:3',5'-cyclic AMP phosphodiesterase CpdA